MRRERLIGWLATVLPQKVAEAPERVLINLACLAIGLSALLSERPGSLLALWPAGFPEAWALTMACGGAFAVVGYWHNPPAKWAGSIERLGYLLILIAALIYGIGVIWSFGWQGVFSGVLYLMIATAKAVRLLMTSAYRNLVLRSGAPGATS